MLAPTAFGIIGVGDVAGDVAAAAGEAAAPTGGVAGGSAPEGLSELVGCIPGFLIGGLGMDGMLGRPVNDGLMTVGVDFSEPVELLSCEVALPCVPF